MTIDLATLARQLRTLARRLLHRAALIVVIAVGLYDSTRSMRVWALQLAVLYVLVAVALAAIDCVVGWIRHRIAGHRHERELAASVAAARHSRTAIYDFQSRWQRIAEWLGVIDPLI